MNCRPGDLAIVIKAATTPEMIGYIVEVIRPAVDGESLSPGFRVRASRPGWVCKPCGGSIPVRSVAGPHKGELRHVPLRAVADSNLRPIRDNDKEDETLSWAGKPQSIPKETA